VRSSARLVLGLVALAVVFGVLSWFAAGQELAESQVLVVGSPDNAITGLDPATFLNTSAVEMARCMYSSLLRIAPGEAAAPDTVEGDLAESWEISSDGTVWTFALRRGVQFHGGYGELTSEDVKYSIERAIALESPYAGDFAGILSIETPDDYTVRIVLSAPDAFFAMKLANLRSSFIVSKTAVETLGDGGFGAAPIGTGPFAFESWTPNEKVVLVRNPDYFRGSPILERIEFLFMGDVNTRILAIKNGDIHCTNSGLDNEEAVSELRDAGIIVDVKGFESPVTLHLNMTVPPFDNPTVRKALAYAINKQDFVDFYGPSLCEIQHSFIPPTIFGGIVDGLNLYEYNPERARNLLAHAGYPSGFAVGEVIVTERELYRIPLEIVQANWAQVGVTMDIKVIAHSEFHAQIRQDLSAVIPYAGARATPDMYLTEFLYGPSIVGKDTAKTNFSHYGEVDADGDGLVDTIDDLIELARVETDTEKAKILYAMAQVKLNEHLPVIPLRLTGWVQARSPLLDLGHGVYQSAANFWGYLYTENTRLLKEE